MSDAIKQAIADAAAKLKDEYSKFWHEGEVPEAITKTGVDALTHGRIKRVREWLLSNGHPVHDFQLKQMMLWEGRSTRPVGTAVLGFKYLLLQAAEEQGQEWTKKIDAAAEYHAGQIVAENKTKIDRKDQ